jgi:hypothetical protein
MIRELISLSDVDSPEQVPYGLLQFLWRLHQEPELAAPIEGWLANNAAGQGNVMANVRQKLIDEAATKTLVIEVNNEGERIGSYDLLVRSQNLLPIPGIVYPSQTVDDWNDFVAKLRSDIKDLAQRHAIVDFEIQFLVNPPLFAYEFHAIPLSDDGLTLGEEYVVLVRHRDRVRSTRSDIRNAWIRYADALRPMKPSDLQLVPIAAGAAGPKGVVPDEKGLCYTRFLLQPLGNTGSAHSIEKDVLRRLLVNGVPYLYWLHTLPEEDGFNKIGSQFAAWLKGIPSLDDFPALFKQSRSAGNDFARRATLLWDDPDFNPFRIRMREST